MSPAGGNTTFVVSKYQPTEWDDDVPNAPAELRRDLRWRLLHEFYAILALRRYRLRDMGSALWKVSVGPIKLELFVVTLMSKFKFEQRAAVDKLLYRLYRTFDGAGEGAADWRDMVASLIVLREYKQVRDTTMHVLVGMFDIYRDTSPRQSVEFGHLQRMFGLVCVTDQNLSALTDWLTAAIAEIAPEYGYKKRPSQVPKRMFLRILEAKQSLVGVFRRQAWARLTEDMRLEFLETRETKSAFNFEAQNEKFLTNNATKLYHLFLCRRVYAAWKLYMSWVNKVRSCRDREMKKRIVRSLRLWKGQLVTLKDRRLKEGAAAALGDKNIKLRIVRRMQQWHVRKDVIKRINLPFVEDNRWLPEGMCILLEVMNARAQEQAFDKWFAHSWELAALDQARLHHDEQMRRRYFTAFTGYLRTTIKQEKKEEAEDRSRKENQDYLVKMMESVQQELDKEAEEERRIEEEQKEKEHEERLRQKKWEAQKAVAEKQAEERHKIERQVMERNARMFEDKQRLRDEHDALFEQRLETEPTTARDIIESYFDSAFQPTAAGRDIVSAEFKKLKRRFFAPPRMEKGGREHILNDPVNIVFVYIDVVLNSQNCSLGELFLAYDQSGSGYMSHDDFITFMKSLPIRLQSEQIKGIIQKVDASGDGFVTLEELTTAQTQALEALGEPASPWKCYVDPAQSVMCYHNILTDEKIYDYKMTDRKLLEILHDNMVSAEYARVKNQILEEEPIAWREMVMNYSARVIQKQWRIHRHWQDVLKEQWRVQLRYKHADDHSRERATGIIRRYMQAFLARRELRYLARICFEKNLDPTTGEAYYMNYNNGSSQWTRPRWLRRIDEDVTLPWSVAFKPGDASGVPQFYHPETATWSEEKPDGYLLCDVCRYYLAYRQCSGQGCDGYRYCFGCFHRYHVWASTRMSRGDHNGVLVSPIECNKCTDKRLAARHCTDCNEDMCKACFIRIHRNPLVAQHVWQVVA